MAEYNDFPSAENTNPGDIVIKNGRQWYYDGTKWVLFADPKAMGDEIHSGIVPVMVDETFESTNNPNDPDETRKRIETSLDLTTLPPAN